MSRRGLEATVLSLVVLGVVLGVGLGSGWGPGDSVVGAVTTAALTWVAVHALSGRRRDRS